MRNRKRDADKNEEEPPDEAAASSSVVAPRRFTRASSVPHRQVGAQSMLHGVVGESTTSTNSPDTTTTTPSPHQLRKRNSANTGTSHKDPSEGATTIASSVASAAAPKQRKVTANTKSSSLDTPSPSTTLSAGPSQGESESRELRSLIDYYPNQTTTEARRITRSQLRAATAPQVSVPPSSTTNPSEERGGGREKNKTPSPYVSARPPSGRGRKGAKASSSNRVAATVDEPSGSSTANRDGDAAPQRTGPSRWSAELSSTNRQLFGRSAPGSGSDSNHWDNFDMTEAMFDSVRGDANRLLVPNHAGTSVNQVRGEVGVPSASSSSSLSVGGVISPPPPPPSSTISSSITTTTGTSSLLISTSTTSSSSSSASILHRPPHSHSTTTAPTTTSMLLESMAQAQAASAASTGSGHRGARSAASAFIGNLVPRMQHLLGGAAHRENHSNNARVSTILEGLKASNEIRQQEAATELADLLLMGNEDSLPPNLPIREIVGLVVQLLQKEHNFELMLTAARCITNMLEALPRAQPIVIEAVPYLLEKLKRIECIDVAEQSLAALEVMSRRNGKNIMAAGGIAATISHVDFFPLASQRLAFSISANCAMYVGQSDFHLVRDSLAELTQRLLNEDKRCLDSICTLFARLIENLRSHPDKLREIAGMNHCLLSNMQQLLLAQPSLLSSSTFPLVIKSLRTMATRCSDIAVALVHMHFASTLRSLFIGSGKKDDDEHHIDIVSRPSNQLAELVYLTGELFPRLPTTGLFDIDSVVSGCTKTGGDGASSIIYPSTQWYWRDEQMWQPFRATESRVLELAKMNGDRELHVSINGNVYQMDLIGMKQTNTMTGTTRELQRKAPSPVKKEATPSSSIDEDRRLVLLQSEPEKIELVARQLFPVLVEIDGSSVGSTLRYESLRVMLRIICPMSANVLRGVLADLPLSCHIASALASTRSKDVCVVVAALQLVHMLLEKLSDVYVPLFRKEGVAHEVAKLAAISSLSSAASSPATVSVATSSSATSSASRSAPSSGVASPALGGTPDESMGMKTRGARKTGERAAAKRANAALSAASSSTTATAASNDADGTPSGSPSGAGASSSSSAPITRNNRHRKRTSPESSPSSSSSQNKEKSRRKSSSSNFLSALRLPSFRGSPSSSPSSATGSPPSQGTPPPGGLTVTSSSMSTSNTTTTTTTSSSSNSALLNGTSSSIRSRTIGGVSSASTQLSNSQKEKLRSWIKKEAELLMKTYLGDSAASSAMNSLEQTAERLIDDKKENEQLDILKMFYDLLKKENVSAFEMKQSGMISALHKYLTHEGSSIQPERMTRLHRFANVFMHIHPNENHRPTGVDGSFDVFDALVQKVISSVALLEQFQVSDMGGIATGGSGGCLRGAQALRFFQSHQIRCNLRRHPGCRELMDWRHGHGSIKVDPLTSISAIERYLSERGIGYVRNSSTAATVAAVGDDSSGEDELSDEDGEGLMGGGGGGSGGGGSASNGGTPSSGEDKKIEIMIGDTPVPGHISVLQALRQYSPSLQEEAAAGGTIGQNLWMSTHTLYYRAVVTTADSAQSTGASSSMSSTILSTTNNPSTAPLATKDRKQKVSDKLWIEGEVESIESPLWSYLHSKLPVDMEDPSVPSLQLLRALYGLNKYWYALFDTDKMLPVTFTPLIPTSSFVCSKLSAKLQRQLSDFLSVATQQIPKWTVDVVKATPFVFPFNMRRSLLYCTAFGRDRALMHLVNQTDGGVNSDSNEGGRGLTPRLERKKVSIKRDDLLKSAEAALLACAGQRAMLEVSFDGEAGTGFGPTLEFYSAISKELQLANLKLWHGVPQKGNPDDGEGVEYISSPHGLHPTPIPYGQKSNGGSTRVKKFELIGRLMAQSLIDARMLDLPLSPLFLSWLIGHQNTLGLPDLEILDPELYKSLRQLTLTDEADFEHLEQYFTLPGNEQFELIKGGRNKPVTKANVMQYAKLVARWRLREGVTRDMEAVRRGFCSIVDSSHLSIFTCDELDQLFCGCPDDAGDRVWGVPAITSSIKPDHGYSHDSDQIKWLIRMLSSFSREEQRRFVQFVTGSPRLPVGGFRALNPPLTVVRKSSVYGNSDEELPSAMTCYNYLKVPPYSSYEVFHERFCVALRFVTSFHLT